MPIVKSYKCPVTSKLFTMDEKHLYVPHLAAVREQRNQSRRDNIFVAKFNEWFAEEISRLDTIPAIERWAEENIRRFIKYYNSRPGYFEGDENTTITDVRIDVKYNKHCSNSHESPRDGVRNWAGKVENTPTGYPGFFGKITYSYKGEWPTAALTRMGIATGGGGGSNGNIRQQVTLFASDWPALTEAYNKQLLVDRLS